VESTFIAEFAEWLQAVDGSSWFDGTGDASASEISCILRLGSRTRTYSFGELQKRC